MSTPLADTTNPDLGLLYAVNGLAKRSPQWLDHLVSWIGEYGILIGLGMLGLVGWLQARRRTDAPVAIAGLLWVPLSVAIAELANLPIAAIVNRPRPFVDHPGLLVLVDGKAGTHSFVSDHSTMTMAVAVSLFLVNRKLGWIAGGLALLQGFCRMFMGVHYPTDVIGGFALAVAVVLLLAPIAMAVLVPFCHALTRTAVAPLIRAPERTGSGGRNGKGGKGGKGRGAAPRGRRRGRDAVRCEEQPPESDLAA
ncbi:phosphatase PAP2 family protein [Kitasatospora sp. NPDC089509]|uniref:phosphatase PAP2 family protein n=1 Tax=Kitasatospora sp. NPDC089509 TaxID=3364079 RepID=UPI003814818B